MIIESASIHNKQKLLQIVQSQTETQGQQNQIAMQMQQEQLAFDREQKQRDYELKLKELELEILKTQSIIAMNNSRAALNVAQTEETLIETTDKELNIAKTNLI